jgi:hypothetical protein
MRASSAYRRAAVRGLRAADDLAAAACGGAVPSWAPAASRRPRGACLPRRRHYTSVFAPRAPPSTSSEARYVWRCVALPVLRRVVAAGLALLSLLVVLAEAGALSPPGGAGDASVFSRLVRGPLARRGAARAALCAAVLGHVTLCTFHTVFKLGVFQSFHLAPRASDAPSLLTGGALLCRFAPPLALNFLSLLHADTLNAADRALDAPRRFAHTVFYTQIGRKLDAVPLLGAHATAVFPAALLLFVAAVACNAAGRMLRLCSWCAARAWCSSQTGLQNGAHMSACVASPPLSRSSDVDADHYADDDAQDAASRRGRELLVRAVPHLCCSVVRQLRRC